MSTKGFARWSMGAWLCVSLAGTGCDPGEQDAACGGPGTICRYAGTGEPAFVRDGVDRLASPINWPMDLGFAPDGRAYVLDWNNHRVRRVNADGRFETVMGNELVGDGPPDLGDLKAPGAPGRDVELNHPTDIEFLPDGRVLIAAWHNHKIRVLDPATGLVTVLIGRGPGSGPDGIPASAPEALLNQPKSVALDRQGNVFVTDSRTQKIRRIGPDGLVSTVAGKGVVGFTGDGALATEATFHMQQANENPEPGGSIAIDGSGRIFLADTYNNCVRVIDPATGLVTRVAGTGTPGLTGDGGPALSAQLAGPRDLEIGPDGRLYIADTDNNRIRVVDLTTGIITTVAGSGTGPRGSGDGGLATAASLLNPFGIAFDARGDLYIADTMNHVIRKVVMR